MKTLRFIGMTLLMVVLCLNFTACGDDDDDDPSNPLVGVWQNDGAWRIGGYAGTRL